MRWLFILSTFDCCLLGSAQVIENPVFDRTCSDLFRINKIELSKDSTYLFCIINVPDDTWVNISPLTYIEDDITKRKYAIIRSDGIPFSPSVRNFDNAMKCEVTLVFPRIANTTRINLIESTEGKGFNVYGINLSDTFSNTYSLAEYDRLSNMAKFWISSGNRDKSIEVKKKEVEASGYLFGNKSNLYLTEMFQLSNLYHDYGNSEEALYWKKESAERCYEICAKLVDSGAQYGEKEYYMNDVELFYDKQVFAFRYYYDNQRWNKAKSLMQNVLNLFKEQNDTSVYIPIIQHYIGLSSYYGKDEEDAEKFFLLSYDSFQKHEKAKQFPVYGELLTYLSLLYNNRGNYEKAYNYSLEASHVCRTYSGENSKEYGFALAGLSNAEIMLNKKEEGLMHAEMASSIVENANDVPLELKEIYRKRISAIKNATTGEPLVQSMESKNSSNIVTYMFEANNDMLSGDYHTAIIKFHIIKDELESHFESADLQSYVRTIVSLSDCLSQTGKLVQADKVLDDALNIFQKNNVKTNLARYLYISKGQLFLLLNNYISAMHCYKQALGLFQQSNDKSIDYAKLLHGISMIDIYIGLYDDAKKQLDEALIICEKFYDDTKNTSTYLTILNGIANNYIKMGNHDKAIEIYKTIIDKATSQSTNRIKALAMCNLADVYLLNNDKESAKTLYKKVLSLETEGYIKEMAEFNLVFCYIKDKDPSAVDRLNNFNHKTKENLSLVFGRFTEYEREKYWNQWSQALTFINNMAVSLYDSPQTRQMAYDNALYTKNMLVSVEQLLGNIVKESNTANDTFTSMQHYKEKLSNKGLSKDSTYTYVEIISQLEKQIINSIPNFSDKVNSQFTTYADVKQLLSDNDVAIEFIYLPQVKIPIEESELSYGALILTKNDDSPRLVSICKEKELEKVLGVRDSVNHYSHDILYSASDQTLYRMIWSKMMAYIQKGSNIYYSPTGYINRINLSAISDGSQRLEDMYDFYEVTTTANIKKSVPKTKKQNNNAYLYGDINYNEDTNIMEEYATTYSSYTPGELFTLRSVNRGAWDMLPATKDEIEGICRILEHNGMAVKVYSKEAANEESFKTMHGNSPDIIHIATHGYYLPDKTAHTTNVFSDMKSYTLGGRHLFYSGLLFAGANNVWTGKEIKNGVEDGILTADEVSRLDLSNTQLVVLSACDTGLGNIDKINGVFGLQRGFKRAGVESILMSLWKVEDEATRILMVEFYKNLMSGQSKHQSLKNAQKYLRSVENGKYDDPKYWASFIMLDGLN